MFYCEYILGHFFVFDKIDPKKCPFEKKPKLPNKMTSSTSKIATENTTKYCIHQSAAPEQGLIIMKKNGECWFPIPCRAILKSGKRKGKTCGNGPKYKSIFCGAHKKYTIENLPDPLQKFLKTKNITLNKGVIHKPVSDNQTFIWNQI